MSTSSPEHDREELLKTFASKFGDAEGEKILDALVTTAWQIQDPTVRVGFSDAILLVLRNRTRGRDLGKPPSVRGSARLRNVNPGLMNQGTDIEE